MSGPDRGTEGVYVQGYFRTRLAASPHRSEVWRHICVYLQRYIGQDAAVLELGAGWCDFANNVRARSVTAMDLDETVKAAAAAHVRPVVGDCTDLSAFSDASFDVVFASNLRQHLVREAASRPLAEAHRVLAPGGRLILLQLNFRLNPGAYFDDFTHVASRQRRLERCGWHRQCFQSRTASSISVRARASKEWSRRTISDSRRSSASAGKAYRGCSKRYRSSSRVP
jgi:ubiquinone/menaquinone biosynthesis C-methylase UbiE